MDGAKIVVLNKETGASDKKSGDSLMDGAGIAVQNIGNRERPIGNRAIN